MNWNERAAGALASLDEITPHCWYEPELDMDSEYPDITQYSPVEDELDKVNSYIRESAERIAMLEKALAQAMETNLQLQLIEAPCILDGVSRNHIGQECIVFGGYYPGEVLGLAAEYPELAQYLRERDDHIVDAQEMVGDDQK